MRRRSIGVALLAVLVGFVVTACDAPPAPPKTGEGKTVMELTPIEPAERQLAQALSDRRAEYLFRLTSLEAYYNRIGHYAKEQWAERELKMAQDAQTFTYQNLGPNPELQAPNLNTVPEAQVVESVLTARKNYLQAVDEMWKYYSDTDQSFKAELVNSIRRRFDPIHSYMYFLDAEVPPSTLRPVRVIPEAEELFNEAYKLYQEGKLLPGFPDRNKERQALFKFQELIQKYPDSVYIAQAAFYIGEIYKEYFEENYRAVLWYQRAWEWDPAVELPARFQAAVVNDFRLHNRGRALELYREVLENETFNASNLSFSRRRIAQLTD